jgi:hypothetical protein
MAGACERGESIPDASNPEDPAAADYGKVAQLRCEHFRQAREFGRRGIDDLLGYRIVSCVRCGRYDGCQLSEYEPVTWVLVDADHQLIEAAAGGGGQVLR